MTKDCKAVSYKELLTFSNLANLEWQFADIVRTTTKDKGGNEVAIHRKLNNALNPNLFVSGYRDPEKENSPIYVYGDKGDGNCDYDKGKKEMRREAGIGMEYSELCFQAKESEETPGDFMKDWEVIYGADNYKIVKDYYDNLYSAMGHDPEAADSFIEQESWFENTMESIGLAEEDEPDNENKKYKPYPSRTAVENKKANIRKLRITVNLASMALDTVSGYLDISFADEVANGAIKSTSKEGAEKTTEKIIYKLSDKLSVDIGQVTKVFTQGKIDKQYWSLKVLKKSIKAIDKELKADQTSDQKEVPEKTINDEYDLEYSIPIDRKLDMFDTGLRVVAFKKEDQIVIAFNHRDDVYDIEQYEKELLPKEKDLLRLVYAKIKSENEDCDIMMTGFNRGADFAGFDSLLYEEPAILFYSKTPVLKNYINYTYDDLNREYDDGWEIVEDELQGVATVGTAAEVVACACGYAAWLPTLIGILGYHIIKGILASLQSYRISELYNDYFVNKDKLDILEEEKEGIKGYIKEKRLYKSGYTIKIKGPEGNIKSIKLKNSDCIYLALEDLLSEGALRNAKYFTSEKLKRKAANYPQYSNKVIEYIENLMKGNSLILCKDGKERNPELIYELNQDNKGRYEITGIYSLSYVHHQGKASLEQTHANNTFEMKNPEDITHKREHGSAVLNTLKIVHSLQKTFLGKDLLKFVYPYLPEGQNWGKEKIKTTKNFSGEIKYQVSQVLFGECDHDNLDNEYLFLPYLKDGKGFKDELSKEYKLKVIEGMVYIALQKELGLLEENNSYYGGGVTQDMREIEHITVRDTGAIDIEYDFESKKDIELLKKLLKKLEIDEVKHFNYFRKIYKNRVAIYENNMMYIRRTRTGGEEPGYGENLIFNKKMSDKNKFEYKYNSADKIVPTLIIKGKNMYINFVETIDLDPFEDKQFNLKMSEE